MAYPFPMQLRSVNMLAMAAGLVWVCALAAATTWGSASASALAWSADLPTVSDGRHLWTWAQDVDEKTDQPRLSLFHANLAHRPPKGPAWEAVVQLTGRLAARGVAADDDTLYLFFDDGSTHVISLRKGPVEDQWYYSKRTAPNLPAGVSVRAAAAGGGGKLWVLVRIESAEALRSIDAASAAPSDGPAVIDDNQELFDLILGFPDSEAPPEADGASDAAESNDGPSADAPQVDPSTESSENESASAATENKTEEATDTDTESELAEATPQEPAAEPESETTEAQTPLTVDLPTERLLVLGRNTWQSIALPESWPQKLPVQIVGPGPEDTQPTLVVQVPTTKGGTLARVFRPGDEGWASVDLPMSGAGAASTESGGGIVALRVEQQLLLVNAVSRDQGFAANVAAVRGDKLLHVVTAVLDSDADLPDSGQWTAIRAEAGVALLAGQRDLGERLNAQVEKSDPATQVTGPTLTAVDLQGRTTLPATAMRFEPADPIAEAADMVIFLGVLITSTVLLFTFWRRVPTADQLQLPTDVVLGDTLRRVFAGLIDITPGLLVGTLAYGLSGEELYARWPGRGQQITFGMMVPGLAAIGVIVGHTALLEIFTRGRSLGKLVTGLRVANLDGTPPRAWQSLVRCLLKSFDLIAYLLLILPLISPHRQRLGDMVARTVVTMKAPPPPEISDEDGESGEDSR